MKYVSGDLETTGNDPNQDQILQVAFVVEDSDRPDIPVEELPHLCVYLHRKRMSGTLEALAMNAWILKELQSDNPKYPVLPADYWEHVFHDFLNFHFSGWWKIPFAGKNAAGFDLMFLNKGTLGSRFSYSVIDPGSVLIDWNETHILRLSKLKERAGLGSHVSHDALEDARDVIRILRTTYPKR